MAELISKGKAESLWLLKKGRFPGITDLHIHQHSNGLTLTATYKGHKEHLDIDLPESSRKAPGFRHGDIRRVKRRFHPAHDMQSQTIGETCHARFRGDLGRT